ncbi:hypothetical protein KFK09_018332 [Dendrobium nobile]|uniref:DUF4378 domain-containing protein n=1 Tax=Dendrobium nobile TaxID=94219 RepID=A0A8T3AUJ5_DENNO|nr:hypothetical protein KFK09_018332 [Dendrobium nobile]
MAREWYWSRSVSKEERERPVPGCMKGMFHFFDFHHLLFTGGCRTPAAATSPPATELQYQQQPQKPQRYHASQNKGVEAPRNSLEFEESEAAIQEDYYGVPISILIEHPSAMAKKKKRELLIEEEKRKSQAVTPRTRSIVARLMGLEGLHDEVSSPCNSTYYESTALSPFSESIVVNGRKSCNEKKKKTTKKQKSIKESKKDSPSPRRPLRNLNSNISGSISLPVTPRASSERPRDTDPRHSLQHNKENSSNYTAQELSFLREVFPASSALRTSKSRKKDFYSYQEENKNPGSQNFVKQMEFHKREGSYECITPSRKNKQTEKKYVRNNQLQPSTVLKPLKTCSPPKPRFSESIQKVPQNPPSTALPSSINFFRTRLKPEDKALKMEPGKSRKTKNNYERFTEKVKRQPPQLTVFSLQTGFLLPPKKEQDPLINHFNVEKEDPEFKYVKAILARADVVGEKIMNWFSPSLPIDPTIFHILELWFPFFEPVSREAEKLEEAMARMGPLRHRWNRKLLFHLVEEILSDLILSEPKRWRRRIDSKLLLSRLWSEIKSFPSADCQVVGDIDVLVAGDLPASNVRRLLRHPSVVAEVQDIASEIQRDILDSLLGDAAASLFLISSFTKPKAKS